MYELKCPKSGCHFTTGQHPTKEEAMKAMTDHSTTAHADDMAAMTEDEKTKMMDDLEMELSGQDTGEAKYKLACADLGTPECPYVSKGNTHDETKGDMKRHAMEVHGPQMAEMTEEDSANMETKMDELLTAQD